MKHYHKKLTKVHFLSLKVKSLTLGVLSIVASILSYFILLILYRLIYFSGLFNLSILYFFIFIISFTTVIGFLLLGYGLYLNFSINDHKEIYSKVFERLYAPYMGNPLGLNEGDLLPPLGVKTHYIGDKKSCHIAGIEIHLSTLTTDKDKLIKLANIISSSLRGKYSDFAVTEIIEDESVNSVIFISQDVTTSRKLVPTSFEELSSGDKTRLVIQDNHYIDLTKTGSILIAGKTRSGKTTGCIALLGQILLFGQDDFNSQVMIIDPKRAELSQLNHTISPDDNGAEPIISSLEKFDKIITSRQAYLNKLSADKGDTVHWWDVGMHPSILFIDEYVALRAMLESRVSKDNPKLNKPYFERLLKRIITMGASTGSFVILSIAQANANELPTMLRDAFSTRILFKPTREEAQLLWSVSQFEMQPFKKFKSGDAWFTSTDGFHDISVNYIEFPKLNFQAYAELNRLLNDYYTK